MEPLFRPATTVGAKESNPRGADTDHLPPAAWLGFAVSPTKNNIFSVRVCCDCEDHKEAEALAAKHGLPVTHTYCPEHYQKRVAEITGDHTESDRHSTQKA